MNEIASDVSDLFFNHQKRHADEYYNGRDPEEGYDSEQLRQAILLDAREFIDEYGHILWTLPEDPTPLADDYMRRL